MRRRPSSSGTSAPEESSLRSNTGNIRDLGGAGLDDRLVSCSPTETGTPMPRWLEVSSQTGNHASSHELRGGWSLHVPIPSLAPVDRQEAEPEIMKAFALYNTADDAFLAARVAAAVGTAASYIADLTSSSSCTTRQHQKSINPKPCPLAFREACEHDQQHDYSKLAGGHDESIAFSKVKAFGSVGMPEESTPICLASGSKRPRPRAQNRSGSERVRAELSRQ